MGGPVGITWISNSRFKDLSRVKDFGQAVTASNAYRGWRESSGVLLFSPWAESENSKCVWQALSWPYRAHISVYSGEQWVALVTPHGSTNYG